MQILIAALIGLIFGAGITLGGMINPAKALNFFDIAGTWDPSLAFVMGAALIVTAIGYRLVWTRPAPVLAAKFQVPTRKDIDPPPDRGRGAFRCGLGDCRLLPRGRDPGAWALRAAGVFVRGLDAGGTVSGQIPSQILN